MRFPLTLSFYIGKQFLFGVAGVLLLFMLLISLVDTLEIIRRSYNKEVPVAFIIEMVLTKLPSMLQRLLPFAVLLGSMVTFSRLTRTSELIIARASGISVWQFLTPAILTSFIVGIFMITIFNPIAAIMLTRFEHIEGRYLQGNTSMLALSTSGLWLQEKHANGNGKTVIHALRASQETMQLFEVTIFVFAKDNSFVQRMDAKTAKLKSNYWELDEVILTTPNDLAEKLPSYHLATTIIPSQIQESFSSPETLSFWQLLGFTQTLKEAGFSALKHQLHWHRILATPILLCGMLLIGAVFSLRPPRQGRTALLIAAGIGMGFIIHFFTDVIGALGIAGSIPLPLAAWAPVAIIVFLGVALMLHFEDG